jgi:hypothetical protein
MEPPEYEARVVSTRYMHDVCTTLTSELLLHRQLAHTSTWTQTTCLH